MLFSQRKGLKPVRTILQVDSVDEGLRNRLWDALKLKYWDRISEPYLINIPRGNPDKLLLEIVWHQYFKKPIDSIHNRWSDTYQELRNYFLGCKWYEVYDFLEFVAVYHSYATLNNSFMGLCNNILEQEMSGYRFVGGQICQITSKQETEEIEQALAVAGPLQPVAIHLDAALAKLSDRKSPDYRNSIKESISAVEALCKLVTKNPKAKLSDALRKLESDVKLHPALKQAFDKMYGYTSDAQGIRHALLEEASVEFEDAKFMLVSCSAFTNYVIHKASKVGIIKL